MSERRHLTPREGLTLRDPDTRAQLPAEGGFVPVTEYWRRRVADGDAVVTDPQPVDGDQPAARPRTR